MMCAAPAMRLQRADLQPLGSELKAKGSSGGGFFSSVGNAIGGLFGSGNKSAAPRKMAKAKVPMAPVMAAPKKSQAMFDADEEDDEEMDEGTSNYKADYKRSVEGSGSKDAKKKQVVGISSVYMFRHTVS